MAILKTGRFAGLDSADSFVQAAQSQSPVIYRVPSVPWPANLQPTVAKLGNYQPGTTITSAVTAPADVLVILYTDPETQAFLDIFTGNSEWTPKIQSTWCPYAHNFSKYKGLISNPKANDTLAAGAFGHLSAMKVAGKNIVLYKTELHPKQDGTGLPFVPVIGQLIGELSPGLVITTGTAGAIGDRIQCGDVTVCTAGRLHLQKNYPKYPTLDSLAAGGTEITNLISINASYIQYAATHLTEVSLPGLALCYQRLESIPGYSFVKKNALPPSIFVSGVNPVPGPQPMVTVSADYMTTDDNNNSEGLQTLGIMNDTDDAFVFYAIQQMSVAKQPKFISVRCASEPQVEHAPFPSTTSQAEIIKILKGIAGSIFGIYEYCSTLNSALACWGVIAGN